MGNHKPGTNALLPGPQYLVQRYPVPGAPVLGAVPAAGAEAASSGPRRFQKCVHLRKYLRCAITRHHRQRYTQFSRNALMYANIYVDLLPMGLRTFLRWLAYLIFLGVGDVISQLFKPRLKVRSILLRIPKLISFIL